MKILYTFLAAGMLANVAQAKTYTITSGKWTDIKNWNNEYPGTTIKPEDVVIISGPVTVNTGIIVEGSLTVQKGACMVGMKDLIISKTGVFVNDGNTVMKRIINEGNIDNNLIMEAMADIENRGNIDNNSNITTGNNFDNYGGKAEGSGGAYFVNNTVYTSPAADFGNDIRVFQGDAIKKSQHAMPVNSSYVLDASFSAEKGVVLNIPNTGKDVAAFSIEKSADGINFDHIETIKGGFTNNKSAISYTDKDVNSNYAYYRVKVINCQGEETSLPVAMVKIPG